MPARVFHADLFGLRKDKYATLREATFDSVEWTELAPTTPAYLFVPQDSDVREEYEQGWSVINIFPVNTVGVVGVRVIVL